MAITAASTQNRQILIFHNGDAKGQGVSSNSESDVAIIQEITVLDV